MKGDIKIYAEFGGNFIDIHPAGRTPTADSEAEKAADKGKQKWLKNLKNIVCLCFSDKNNLG